MHHFAKQNFSQNSYNLFSPNIHYVSLTSMFFYLSTSLLSISHHFPSPFIPPSFHFLLILCPNFYSYSLTFIPSLPPHYPFFYPFLFIPHFLLLSLTPFIPPSLSSSSSLSTSIINLLSFPPFPAFSLSHPSFVSFHPSLIL